jgi:nucleoside-diphosphate-sugar epimerase
MDLSDTKQILVTGGCGFIGANLVAMLESSGYTARVVDDTSKDSTYYRAGFNADIRDRTGGVDHESDQLALCEPMESPADHRTAAALRSVRSADSARADRV